MDEEYAAIVIEEEVCFVRCQQVTLRFARDVPSPELGRSYSLNNEIEQGRLTVDGCECCIGWSCRDDTPIGVHVFSSF